MSGAEAVDAGHVGERPDPLDDVLREAHRRSLVVLAHPTAGLLFIGAIVGPAGVVLASASHDALRRLDQMTPGRPAQET